MEPGDDLDSTIHGFNSSNVTVIERSAAGDGSDSGVEDVDLQRKNSTSLPQDLKDSGSETSSTSSRPSTSSKKLVVHTPKTTTNKKVPPKKQPVTPRPSTLKTTATPKTTKPLDNRPKPARSISSSRTPRTPVITPTDDGRWPSNSKNTMTRSFRATSVTSAEVPAPKTTALDKYGTLPRRRRERSADNIREPSATRINTINTLNTIRKQPSRESTPARSLPPYPKKRTRIFAETSAQTSLTLADVARLVGGGTLLERGERTEIATQTERDNEPVIRALREQMRELQAELEGERRDKVALQGELERNMQRIQAILDNKPGERLGQDGDEDGNDSLLELASRFEGAGQIIVKQENEISELHSLCRTLQRELDISDRARRHLESTQAELEAESRELQEFLAAEKWALCEALSEAEARGAAAAVRVRHDALALETRSRDLLLAQGAAVSGAAVALSGLAHRLDTLTARLAHAYHISDLQLDDDVFHNEAYNPDTPDTPQNDTSDTSDTSNTSFLSAVISAIRNTVTETEELLDSETEPCLMMENVLEDVVHVDTHSHNLVSEPGASASSLVDQVIEADNLLTRLLKVLRLIQRAQDAESASLKADLQQHRRHVERLSQDVCALSTACSTQRENAQNSTVETVLESFEEQLALNKDLNANPGPLDGTPLTSY